MGIRCQRGFRAAFRLHGDVKTPCAAAGCWPEMIRVHRRLGGSRLSFIWNRSLVRRVLEPVMPYGRHTRLWMRKWAMARAFVEREGKVAARM